MTSRRGLGARAHESACVSSGRTSERVDAAAWRRRGRRRPARGAHGRCRRSLPEHRPPRSSRATKDAKGERAKSGVPAAGAAARLRQRRSTRLWDQPTVVRRRAGRLQRGGGVAVWPPSALWVPRFVRGRSYGAVHSIRAPPQRGARRGRRRRRRRPTSRARAWVAEGLRTGTPRRPRLPGDWRSAGVRRRVAGVGGARRTRPRPPAARQTARREMDIAHVATHAVAGTTETIAWMHFACLLRRASSSSSASELLLARSRGRPSGIFQLDCASAQLRPARLALPAVGGGAVHPQDESSGFLL